MFTFYKSPHEKKWFAEISKFSLDTDLKIILLIKMIRMFKPECQQFFAELIISIMLPNYFDN